MLDAFEHSNAINTNSSSLKYNKIVENHFFLPQVYNLSFNKQIDDKKTKTKRNKKEHSCLTY